MICVSYSPEDTKAFGEKMAQKAKIGDIICLCGQLGAGKTAFAQGFARGMGVKGNVNSPTFTLMHIYESGRLPLYHFDLYRLADPTINGTLSGERTQIDLDTLEDIGFFDYLGVREGHYAGVCLIEWAEYVRDFIPDGAVWVKIKRGDDESHVEKRTIQLLEL